MSVLKSVSLVACTSLLAACGGGSSSTAETAGVTTASVTLPFEAVYNSNNDPVSCNVTMTGLGAGVDAQLLDFRLYVHDVTVTTTYQRELALTLDSNAWQGAGVALLDFRDYISCETDPQEPRTVITGQVDLEEGEALSGVYFTLGVPETLNHNNLATAPTPLNVPTLHWSWQTGYKFLRMDVSVDGGQAFNLHLGSTDCAGDATAGESVSCSRSNRPEVGFADFTFGQDVIVIDYGAMVAGAIDGVDDGGALGCMSGVTDPECGPVFSVLGLDLDTGASTGTQTAFRLK
ncbi:MbnP family copper-binding protein [Marinobacter zhejiangensis]|uniref:AZL_007920/MXAN_0976 family protein n=1 Tax=Marinobacter zhejiangensis TaxID=488535 RepID=A0A1I4QTD4_9GAMM|nr:MbnP family copper-binding protein [Marinobacter zhejiangensis]SFM43289.1 AZL_007920/MXAN_0976 family protein [Marinobacter zhejiangensis]